MLQASQAWHVKNSLPSPRPPITTFTAVLAPVLEESVFRGFLLPSLTRVLPVPLAVLASSAAFGLIHLTPRDFPQVSSPRNECGQGT